MIYAGAGYVADGGAGYEDADEAPSEDIYDWEFDEPPHPRPRPRPGPIEPGGTEPGGGGGGGEPGEPAHPTEPAIRREERTREHPQFATRYDQPVDLDKLLEALEWATTQATTQGAVRWDDIHDQAGEVAGRGFWVGLGRDTDLAAFADALHEALLMVGIDISRTLVGAGNLRRGLERAGATIKQSFFRFFVPSPGWKLLTDWTILREGEKKQDLHPDLQTMVRERQRARRAEIMRELRRVTLEERRAEEQRLEAERRAEAEQRAAEAEARAAALRAEAEARAEELRAAEEQRLEAERQAEELRTELAQQDRALVALGTLPRPAREALTDEIAALFAGHAPPDWGAAVQRAVERVGPPSGWQAAAAKARREERAAERKAEANRLDRRARYLENRAGAGRTRAAREQRAEAQVLRERAAKLKPKR